jgi:hypothetical protein
MDCPESDLSWYSSFAPSNAQKAAQVTAHFLLATYFQIPYSLAILPLDVTKLTVKWMDTILTNNLSEEPCHSVCKLSRYNALKFR